MNSRDQSAALWVCWQIPRALPRDFETILSFLSPASEERLKRSYQGPVIPAREASRDVRVAARDLYVKLVARLGATVIGGKTFRQILAPSGQASRWWYHQVAFKDCEADPIFDRIIAALTVQHVASQSGSERLVLFGAPSALAQVLRSAFAVETHQTRLSPPAAWTALVALASRVRYGLRTTRRAIAARRQRSPTAASFDVVFCGSWDWSLWWDEKTRSVCDRYYGSLPAAITRETGSSVGWFAWLDPDLRLSGRRQFPEIVAPVKRCTNVILLQALLGWSDIVRSTVDLRPLWSYLRVRRRRQFRLVFRIDALDYTPLFLSSLLRGFLDGGIPHCDLVALATERACRRYRPRVTANFLEHFPHARAHFEGVRRARTATVCFVVQHASYCRQKSYLFLDPALEFRGEPDGNPVPHPDYVCAMGGLGRELYLECGYASGQVPATGSPRYEHIKDDLLAVTSRGRAGESRPLRVLMLSTLHLDAELEMVEAACSAVCDLPQVRLFLRNHPTTRIERDRRFRAFRDKVEITTGSLEQDLAEADLILFTYSTAADEAFVRGTPTWQWLPVGFNGSALAEVVSIPQLRSVGQLREALKEFSAHRGAFNPSQADRRRALERLFHRGDGEAATRILKLMKSHLAAARFEGGASASHSR